MRVDEPEVAVRVVPFVKRRLSADVGATVATVVVPTFQLPTVFQAPEVPAEPPVQTYWAAFAFGVKNNDSPRKIAPRDKFEFNFLFIFFGSKLRQSLRPLLQPILPRIFVFVFILFT